jgi:hypothetical protein
MYYQELPSYVSQIVGPRTTRALQETRHTLDTRQYPHLSYMFVPPVTFQSRFRKVECADFAKTSANVFETHRMIKCNSGGYQCESLEPVIQCVEAGAEQTYPQRHNTSTANQYTNVNESYFGRPPITYNIGGVDTHVFSEFLMTFQKDMLLYRPVTGGNGQKQWRELDIASYINAGTKTQHIVALLFTPIFNTASSLTVSFDFSTPQISATYEVQHYRGLTDKERSTVLGCDVSLIACSILMLVLLLGDVWVERISFVLHAKEAVAHEVGELRRKASGLEEFSKPRPAEVKRQPTMAIIKETNAKMQQKRQIHFAVLTKLMLIFLEALQGSFILAYAVQHLHDARGSNLRLQKVYGDALTIPWLSPTVDLQLKVQDFVAANRKHQFSSG